MALSSQGQAHSTWHNTFAPWVRVSSDRHTSGSTAPPHLGSTRYSAKLVEDMASINHGPWRPCVRARARMGVTCMSPTWMKDTVRHRKSHPASTSEPNTTQTHESALHDGMPIHGCMSCRGQHEGRVGPVASSGKERRAGICNRVRECNLYLWK